MSLAGGGESRGGEEQWDGFFVHSANSRNTWCTATIYIPDLMTPWEVCRSCNESNSSLFAQSCTCLCVKAHENTELQHCDAKVHFVSKQSVNGVTGSVTPFTRVIWCCCVYVCAFVCVSDMYFVAVGGCVMGFRCALFPAEPTLTTHNLYCVSGLT